MEAYLKNRPPPLRTAQARICTSQWRALTLVLSCSYEEYFSFTPPLRHHESTRAEETASVPV